MTEIAMETFGSPISSISKPTNTSNKKTIKLPKLKNLSFRTLKNLSRCVLTTQKNRRLGLKAKAIAI